MQVVSDADGALEKWKIAHSAEYVSHREVDKAEIIPADRTFRNAWVDVGTVQVDMPQAKEIYKDVLRALREPKLEELDVAYQRADEVKNEPLKAEIVAKKNALRDITDDPAIAAATTPEELKAFMPAILTDDVTVKP